MEPENLHVRAGLRVAWTDSPGPFFGALQFRVGFVDETLRSAGISHLVEHVALSPIGRRVHEYNGRVEDALTTFYASGSETEVLAFLSDVARSLGELQADKLEAERRILTREEYAAGVDFDARLLALRFGPAGYGLRHYTQFGIGWLGMGAVREWAARYFTVGNAVAWFSRKPPEDWAAALPPGDACAPPSPQPISSLVLPAHLSQGSGGVALTMVAERSADIHAGFAIAAERAHARLRADAGLSYSPSGSYAPLDGKTVHIVLHADCRDQEAGEVQEVLLGIFEDLATAGPTAAELEWDANLLNRMLDDPDSDFDRLQSDVRNMLIQTPYVSDEELRHERAALRPETVARAVAQALETLLILAPDGVAPPPGRELSTYGEGAEDAVEGRRLRATAGWREWGENSEIIVGRQGLSYVTTEPDDVFSVCYSEVIAAIPALSGSLTVVRPDGSSATLHPARYEGGPAAIGEIAAHVGADAIIPLTQQEQALATDLARLLPEAQIGRAAAEVDSLPGVLADHEELRLLAEARRDQLVGLLVITDRRVMFLFWGRDQRLMIEKPLTEVRRAETKGLLGKRLIVTLPDETLELHDMAPSERIAEAAALLRSSGAAV